MKILLVTNDYPNPYFIGGQGVVVRETARRLAAKGHRVRVLGADRDHKTGWETLPAHEFDDAVEIVRLEARPWPKQVKKFRLLPPVLRIRSLLKSVGHFLWADVAHFHNFWATGFLMPLFYVVLALRKRYIFTPYYEDYTAIDHWQTYSYEKLLRLFCQHAQKVTVLSKKEAEILSRFTSNTAIVPPGIDLRKFRDIHPEHYRNGNNSHTIISVGTMSPRKNYVTLLKALANVSSPWRLVVVTSQIADPAYYEEFKRTCRHVGIKKRVEVRIGISDDELLALYRRADLFIMPSLWESFGIAAAEAMACGIPAVLSSNCMITDFLDDGVNTVIVDAGNEMGIAAAIGDLLANRERARSIGRAGRETMGEYFTWERVAEDFEKIYREALGRA